MQLNLGVIDIPYAEIPDSGPVEMTGEVAQKLERNYGVMQFFFDQHADFVALELEDSFAGALANALMGAPKRADSALFNQACSKIETKFKYFIDNKEMDGKAGGVPTKASLEGVSHRFKYKNRKRASKSRVRNNPVRPSFQDTGLYEASFKAWVE